MPLCHPLMEVGYFNSHAWTRFQSSNFNFINRSSVMKKIRFTCLVVDKNDNVYFNIPSCNVFFGYDVTDLFLNSLVISVAI